MASRTRKKRKRERERGRGTAGGKDVVAYDFLRVADRMHFYYGFTNLLLAKYSNKKLGNLPTKGVNC